MRKFLPNKYKCSVLEAELKVRGVLKDPKQMQNEHFSWGQLGVKSPMEMCICFMSKRKILASDSSHCEHAHIIICGRSVLPGLFGPSHPCALTWMCDTCPRTAVPAPGPHVVEFAAPPAAQSSPKPRAPNDTTGSPGSALGGGGALGRPCLRGQVGRPRTVRAETRATLCRS